MHFPGFISDLAVLLLAASATGLLCRVLGQPAVLGYLAAGLIVGPYLPLPVFADPEHARSLADLGVVLVMFVVGLDLRLRRLVSVLPTAGVTAILEVAVLLGAGFGLGLAVGLARPAALFLGAALSISSTMVVSKVYDEQHIGPDVRDFVMSVLVLQDVLAIVLVAVLTAVRTDNAVSGADIADVLVRLLALVLVVLVAGAFLVPPLIRRVVKTQSSELLVVVSTGLCFGLALFAQQLGYSVALGAFFAGMLVAESGEGARVEVLLRPLRDVFGAIFFVAIGMTVNPSSVWAHKGTSLLAFALVVVAQLVSVSVSGVLLGNGLRRSVTAGLSLGQVGEFGFIIAAIGTRAGSASAGLESIIVSVAVLSAFTTPIAVRHRSRIARAIDHALPRRLQDVLSLYEAWFERLRAAPVEAPGSAREPSVATSGSSALRRTGLVICLDGLATSAILVGSALWEGELRALLQAKLGLATPWDWVVLSAVKGLVVALPAISFLRATRLLGHQVAERALGSAIGHPGGQLLLASVQLAVLLGVGIPCAVIVVPFAGVGIMVAVAALVGLVTVFVWRSAGKYAEVQHSAERLMGYLAERSAPDPGTHGAESLEGLGFVHTVALEASANAVGRTLAEIDLRATTGATAVGIRREDSRYQVPTGRELLRSGDLLAVVGSVKAIAEARALLLDGASPEALDREARVSGS